MATGFPARMVAVAAIFAATATTARADRRPVAVISVSEDTDATQLANELFNTLVNHPDLQTLANPAFVTALRGSFGDEDASYLSTARQARADAETSLGLPQPEFGNAAAAVRRGTEALAQATPTADMLQIYADLMFDLGQAQLGQGKTIDASRSFALARRLDPTRTLDPARYLQEIVDAYDAAAKPVSKSPLTVKGSGTVWIDGKAYGDAPQTPQIDDGLHFVELTGADREPRGEQVLVPQAADITVADAKATEELKVRRARIELKNARDPVTRASAVKRLAQLLGVGDAVIISKPDKVLLVQTWRDRDPGFSAIREHTTEKPLDLLTPLAPPRKIEPPRPEIIPVPPPPHVEKPWYSRNWVRASAATGVVAIIVSAILISRYDPMVEIGPDIKKDQP